MLIRVVDTYLTFRRSLESTGHCSSVRNALNTYFSRNSEVFSIIRECLSENNVLDSCSKVLSNAITNVEELDRVWNKVYMALPKALLMFTQKFSDIFYDKLWLILYISCGCGAGWAYEYREDPAVYLGLDMIAYLKWLSESEIKGLIVHELCHLLNMKLQNTTPREFSRMENNPYFLLYSEGFAMRCEHRVMGGELWRIASNKSWISWCRRNLNYLAKLYLEYAGKGLPVNIFYGSFYNIRGYSQTGYFLGHEAIKYLEQKENMELTEIAKLHYEDILYYMEKALRELS